VLEHRERPFIGAAVEAREPEEERLVLLLERPDLSFPIGQGDPFQYAIARSTASCSSGESATDARPRSSSLT
jgi:hypothetical protein